MPAGPPVVGNVAIGIRGVFACKVIVTGPDTVQIAGLLPVPTPPGFRPPTVGLQPNMPNNVADLIPVMIELQRRGACLQ